jgi:hypothetical protein
LRPVDGLVAPELDPLRSWSEDAFNFWEALASSPAASQYVDSDWVALERIARLVDAYSRATEAAELSKLSTEIRLAGADYGLSPVARARLHWTTPKTDAIKPTQSKVDRPRKADPRDILRSSGDFLHKPSP